MEIMVFGLSVSSSWGNGHATIWRGLIRELVKRGHRVTFFEKDVPYYAFHRDYHGTDGMEVKLYTRWEEIEVLADKRMEEADAVIITSYCPDARVVSAHLCGKTKPLKVYYDLDSPVTLKSMLQGCFPDYIPAQGLGEFDIVLSFTGGMAIEKLKTVLGAREAVPLYGCADPFSHYRVDAIDQYRGDLSYLGTYAADRQRGLDELFIKPARQLREHRFVIGGAQYPEDFPWTENMFFLQHVPPADHPQFYCSSRFTLNVTRQAMAEMGYCPSGRLFEAAICGVPILSDWWSGLDYFFIPEEEIVIVRSSEDVQRALMMSSRERRKIAEAALRRVHAEHTSEKRAETLLAILEGKI